jgi:hypothetical protein
MKGLCSLVAGVVVITSAGALSAAIQDGSAITGKWEVTSAVQPSLTQTLELTANGKRITGALAAGGGDRLAVDGEFIDGRLTFATTQGAVFTGTLKDGVLTGTCQMLEAGIAQHRRLWFFTWTAKRPKS